MDVARILDPDAVRCAADVRSKKHALDILSEMLAAAAGKSDAGEVLNGLASRERLGSTALGDSVAMPHARLPGLTRPVAAFLRLAAGVDFDSPDGKPVDLLFGLLVPWGSSNQELKELRELAKKLRDPGLQQRLRAAEDAQTLHRLLCADDDTGNRRRINA
jgi:PTS system nitrogen regulatory IIA component